MGIEDQFSHFLMLAGAFVTGTLYTDDDPPKVRRVILWLGGFAMLVVGLVDRIADHL